MTRLTHSVYNVFLSGVRPMRATSRIAVLACLSAGFCFAQDQDFSKVQIKVSKVAGSVYMLVGAGGNIGASVGDDGIVIVDDQYAPLADKIQAALKGITESRCASSSTRITTKTIRAGTNSSRSRRRLSLTIMFASGWKRAARRATAGRCILKPSRSLRARCRLSRSITTSPCT